MKEKLDFMLLMKAVIVVVGSTWIKINRDSDSGIMNVRIGVLEMYLVDTFLIDWLRITSHKAIKSANIGGVTDRKANRNHKRRCNFELYTAHSIIGENLRPLESR